MRWMPLGGVVASALALTLAGGSAVAAAAKPAPKPQDVKGARTVVRDLTGFDQTSLRREGEMNLAGKAMLAQVQAGCAGALPASVLHGTKTQQSVAFDVLFEVGFDLSLKLDAPINRAAMALGARLDRVRFTKRALRRGAHRLAKIETLFVAVRPSDVCADVKAAAANGFTSDPPGTTRVVGIFYRVLATSLGRGPDILKQLPSYLITRRDRAALKRLHRLDARNEKLSTSLGAKWSAKLSSVLSPPAPPGGGTGGFPTSPPPGLTGAAPSARMLSAFAALR
ncbi:MAG TPA: hypothetical protein VGF68_00965 [Solirubrobacteraceae bacterium]